MRKIAVATALMASIIAPQVKAELLFERFLIPDESDYFTWNGLGYGAVDRDNPFGAPGLIGNGPFNGLQLADSFAEYAQEPTLTQTNSSAYMLVTSTTGGLYSVTSPLSFRLDNSSPYAAKTVVLQYESLGNLYDRSSFRLAYNDGTGIQYIDPTEYITEYRYHLATNPDSANGLANRVAFQWDLSQLNITDYWIEWGASHPHASLVEVHLDNSPDSFSLVPEKGVWTGAASGNWSSAGNWQGGQRPDQYGNALFQNAAAVAVNLDSDQTVGELNFLTANDVTISSGNGSVLALNSGINTATSATGRYEISADIELVSYAFFDIKAGEVQISGSIGGDVGFAKTGDGKLILSGHNTFGAGNGNVGFEMSRGIVRMEGINEYGGFTSILSGTLEVAGDVLNNVAGVLGDSDKAIYLGGVASLYQHMGGLDEAVLHIDGAYTIERAINIAGGNFKKTISASNASGTGAVISGGINLASGGAADNVHFRANGVNDKLTFSGAITSGASTTVSVTIGGAGEVVYSGVNKTYNSRTIVESGRLRIASALTGNGAVEVKSGGTLIVDGSLGYGNGAQLILQQGATLSGDGTILRAFTVGNGVVLDPGNSVGTLNTVNQTWQGGGILNFEVDENGWDQILIDGNLTFSGAFDDAFQINIEALTAALVDDNGGFDPNAAGQWTFLTVTGEIIGFNLAEFEFNGLGVFAGGTFDIIQQGNSLVLTYVAPIPEPSTYALVGAGALLYGFLRRRKKAA